MIIDMQEGFRFKESEAIIPKIKWLSCNFDGDVAFSCFENKKGSMFEKSLKWKRFQKKREQELFKELRDVTARKFRHSGYTVLNKVLLAFINKSITRQYSLQAYTLTSA